MIDAAKRAGVDLLSNIPRPPQLLDDELRAFMRIALGQNYNPFYDTSLGTGWPTRGNLEI